MIRCGFKNSHQDIHDVFRRDRGRSYKICKYSRFKAQHDSRAHQGQQERQSFWFFFLIPISEPILDGNFVVDCGGYCSTLSI